MLHDHISKGRVVAESALMTELVSALIFDFYENYYIITVIYENIFQN